jgi:hypothetical protein
MLTSFDLPPVVSLTQALYSAYRQIIQQALGSRSWSLSALYIRLTSLKIMLNTFEQYTICMNP